MSDDEKNKEFSDTLFDAVFGSFGKSTIRGAINNLWGLERRSFSKALIAGLSRCDGYFASHSAICADVNHRHGSAKLQLGDQGKQECGRRTIGRNELIVANAAVVAEVAMG